MSAQRSRRIHGPDGLHNCAADSFFLAASGYRAEDCVSCEESGYGNRERLVRYVAKGREALVIHLLLPTLRIEIDDLDGKRIFKVGRRIVKREMAIGPKAATDNINRSGVELRGIAAMRTKPESLRPQRHQRIDIRRAPRRNHAGSNRNQRNAQHREGKRSRIVRLHPVK
jgi:hypothetical protein